MNQKMVCCAVLCLGSLVFLPTEPIFAQAPTDKTGIHVSEKASKAAQWDRFRGPNGTGFVADAKLPTKWSEKDYAWKTSLAGKGSSSPVIWKDRIYINSCNTRTGDFLVQCLHLKDGKEAWVKKFDSATYRMHSRNSFASSTCAVDEQHVYVAFGNPEHIYLAALDHQGNEVWKRDLGKYVSAHGFGSSPIVYQDKVIFVNSQQAQRLRRGTEPGESHIMAFECKTGKPVWSTKLTPTTACYALPCVLSQSGKKDQLVCCNTGEGFYSVDPDDGSINWKQKAFALRTVASTLLAGDLLIGSCGSGGGGNRIFAVRPTEKGAEKVFEVGQNANYVPTPVAVGELLFTFSDRGIASCIRLKDGEVLWRERVAKGFSGSAVANNSHVYCIDESGIVVVLAASETFELAGKNELGEASRSTPAIVGNQLILRTDSQLICIGK